MRAPPSAGDTSPWRRLSMPWVPGKHGRRMTARERHRAATKGMQRTRWAEKNMPLGLHAVGDDDGEVTLTLSPAPATVPTDGAGEGVP